MRTPVVKGGPVGVASIWPEPHQAWQFIRYNYIYIFFFFTKKSHLFNVTFPSMHSVGRSTNFQMYMYFSIMIHLHA